MLFKKRSGQQARPSHPENSKRVAIFFQVPHDPLPAGQRDERVNEALECDNFWVFIRFHHILSFVVRLIMYEKLSILTKVGFHGSLRTPLDPPLYKKILDLIDEESISGEAVVELVYKFDKKSYCECLKR